jgi:hypothetical protein
LRVAIAQVTDVDDSRDGIQEYCRLLASPKTEAATIAFFTLHPYDPKFLVPGKGIPLAGREALLALDASERRIDTLFFPYQDLDSGSSGIELLFMRESANLLADTAAGTFLMINANLGSAFAYDHFGTSVSNFTAMTSPKCFANPFLIRQGYR